MFVTHGKTFTAGQAWGARQIARMGSVTTRLHWTDTPYHWHVNTGEEVFVVLDGVVEMRYRVDATEHRALLGPGDIFHAGEGLAHVAHPVGEARILVVEQEGSE
jgi:uncharacterized cupin superfamily protein